VASQRPLQLCNHLRELVVAFVIDKNNNHFINWLKIIRCVVVIVDLGCEKPKISSCELNMPHTLPLCLVLQLGLNSLVHTKILSRHPFLFSLPSLFYHVKMHLWMVMMESKVLMV
jgi:hypothetical protein